jgi:hypothetical protein
MTNSLPLFFGLACVGNSIDGDRIGNENDSVDSDLVTWTELIDPGSDRSFDLHSPITVSQANRTGIVHVPGRRFCDAILDPTNERKLTKSLLNCLLSLLRGAN